MTLDDGLDRPGHGGHVVPLEFDLLNRVALGGRGDDRGQEQALRDAGLAHAIGFTDAVHLPGAGGLGGGVDLAVMGNRDRRPKRVDDGQRGNADRRPHRDGQGNEKPVIAVDQVEVEERQSDQVLRPGGDRGEVDAAVLEFPEPHGGHAGKRHQARDGRRADVNRGGRGCRIAERCTRSGVEGVPIHRTARLLGCLEGEVEPVRHLRRDGKLILEALGRPGLVGSSAAEKSLRPGSPALRGDQYAAADGGIDCRRWREGRRRLGQGKRHCLPQGAAVRDAAGHQAQVLALLIVGHRRGQVGSKRISRDEEWDGRAGALLEKKTEKLLADIDGDACL